MAREGNVALEKEELEKQKLIAEIDDLKARQESTGKHKRRESIQIWTTILVSVTTLIYGAATIGDKLNDYIKQSARAQTLLVDQKLIDLVRMLNSNEEKEQEYAMVLLTSSETNSVPILLKALEWIQEPDRIISVLGSLKKQGKLRDFDKDFLKAATDVFQRESENLLRAGNDETKESDRAHKTVINYLMAIEGLYGSATEMSPVLKELRKTIESKQPPVDRTVKKSILKIIKRIEGGK